MYGAGADGAVFRNIEKLDTTTCEWSVAEDAVAVWYYTDWSLRWPQSHRQELATSNVYAWTYPEMFD